jgi:hypothetical protein
MISSVPSSGWRSMQTTNRYSFTRLAVTWRLSIMLASSTKHKRDGDYQGNQEETGHKEEEKPRREQNEKRKRRETTRKLSEDDLSRTRQVLYLGLRPLRPLNNT